MMANEAILEDLAADWQGANQAFLDSHLKRLRLLLQRRVHWLRQSWRHDPLQSYQGLVISEAQADWLLSGDDRRAEGRFYQENAEAAQISQGLADVEREIAEQGRLLFKAGRPPALERLVHLFGLTPFERNVLVLCLAPEMDPTFERLYAYVQDDVTCKYATPYLAWSLFATQDDVTQGHRQSLAPDGVLRRYRLVTLEAPATTQGTRPLRLGVRIGAYLMGVNRFDESTAEFLHPTPPALLTACHVQWIDRLHTWIETQRGQARFPAINLIGPSTAGKRDLAKGLCERLGINLSLLDVSRIPAAHAERDEVFRLLEREAVLLEFALYLDATKTEETAESSMKELIDAVIEGLNVFLFVGSRERWKTERRMMAAPLPKPDSRSQRALWEQALTGIPHTLNGEIGDLVQQFEVGPSAISRIVQTAQDRACLRRSGENARITAEDLWQACREEGSWHLDVLAQRIEPCYAWDDIILPEEVFCQLRDIAAQVANRSKVYETWGFGDKLNRGRGISALFAGPSGTGKTMAAEILANHLSLNLYRIDLAGVVSKYIGETEKNLRKVFDASEQSGAILFFDEADALFGKRSEVKDSHDRYANIEIDYLLQRMEDYRGLAILATNMKSLLDPAFLRRLRFVVDFPFPGAAHRSRIWQRVFPETARVEDLDYSLLSRMEISGGNIRNIALNAAFLAADKGKTIRMEHVLKASRREYAKMDKLMQEPDFGPSSSTARG